MPINPYINTYFFAVLERNETNELTDESIQ